MDKVKGISIIVIAVISVVVIVLVSTLLLDTTGKVNQGNFRISDITIQSSATLTEVQDTSLKLEKLSDIVFDVSQTNTISILIESNMEAQEILLQNIVVEHPTLEGDMSICQKDYDKYEITDELTSIPVYLEMEDGKYIITLLIDNDNVVMDKSVSDDVEEIYYDARIFELLGVNTDELKFSISFDVVITDTTGQKTSAHVSLSMPTDETYTAGMSILRQDVTDCIFTIVK